MRRENDEIDRNGGSRALDLDALELVSTAGRDTPFGKDEFCRDRAAEDRDRNLNVTWSDSSTEVASVFGENSVVKLWQLRTRDTALVGEEGIGLDTQDLV